MKLSCLNSPAVRRASSLSKLHAHVAWTFFFGLLACAPPGRAAEDVAPLPSGVRAVWDLDKADREATSTRERVCLNGLWQWQPDQTRSEQVPSGNWGWFKAPGYWPDLAYLMEKPPVRIPPTDVPLDRVLPSDCQKIFAHPSWKTWKLDRISSAWYQRKFTVPANWTNHRITLSADYVNSIATVYVDGRRAGDIRWPGGDLDITSFCRPGVTHVLSMLVTAVPLNAVMMSYSDTIGARQVRGTVERRGLCGDIYLVGTPTGASFSDVAVRTSVRKWEITFDAGLQNVAADASYTLRAQISDHGKRVAEFTSKPFKGSDVKDGQFAFTESWKPGKLWDTITPQNMYDLRLSLADGGGKILDAALPEHFGFREFWIDGRDFYLNGTRIFLYATPLNNAQMGVAMASYQGVKETLERIKSFGVNFVYTHNYGCSPGVHVSFAEELKAADDEGMLVALSQPHFGQYQWNSPDADKTNGYARHAAFYARAAGNHPSVVFYVTSHNSAGTAEMQNPDQMDGIHDVRPASAATTVNRALRVEAILNRLDPSRIVYHHSGGNLGTMHTANFYVNLAPIQEMSDWFGHWAAEGVKPVFLCEYGGPIYWDWGMYRGWFKGERNYGGVEIPWDLSISEWNAEFLGDRAYKTTELEKAAIRWEAGRFLSGHLWHRWDYPSNAIQSPLIDQRAEVMAMYNTDNFRAFRTWGLSAFCPWDKETWWKLRPDAKHGRKEFKVDWDKLQRPGLSPDYVDTPKGGNMQWIDTYFERADWIPTAPAKALMRNNMPLLAYIGGKPAAFTSKDHNFHPGDTVDKQIIVINNSRLPVKGDCRWSLALPKPVSGRKEISIETGQQERVPLSFRLPAQTPPGQYVLSATVKFSNGQIQSDTFQIDVLPQPAASKAGSRIALFDPKGETTTLLKEAGVQCSPVDANADLSAYDTLIVGREALAMDSPAPDIARVRDGLKVVLFEQTSPVLEQRFGFRVEEQGLRRVFKRVSDHPLLAGIGDENLMNWRGAATLLSPSLKYETGRNYVPQVKWCDMPAKHLWRCGNRGNVASVIIEKPARGDFMPILDGGFSLQFSPLLEYREGKGMMLFCQMDVTGRTESDPAAEKLTRNILDYVAAWKPAPSRKVLYVGSPAGKSHLEHAGITPEDYQGGPLSTDNVLVVGSGGGKTLASQNVAVAEFLKTGGRLLAMGLDEQEANAFLPWSVKMNNAEHIAAFFDPFDKDSLLAGVSPADVHNREPRTMPLVSAGAAVIGDGVLARAQNANVVFCQLAPYEVSDAQGAPASFAINSDDAVDGRCSVLVNLGSTTEQGGQFGQRTRGTTDVTSNYTFAVFIKAVDKPVTIRLEVSRDAWPWDLADRSDKITVGTNGWTEVHATFRIEMPFSEGWQACIHCDQDGAVYRADMFRLYEGNYVPWKAGAPGTSEAGPGGRPNLFKDPSFESGSKSWFFNFGEQYNVRKTYRRSSFLMTRLLANLGGAGSTPILERFHQPVEKGKLEARWHNGLYLDVPEEWDDPYRFFCW